MEYVEGESLAALLARDGALPVARALTIAGELCDGLDAAHCAGIVHGDLKPGNVLVETTGRIVITDFGIARAGEYGGVSRSAGTPACMAPEQVESAGDIDARADLYALGAVLYEMLTGSVAWTGTNALAVATARLFAPPPDPRHKNRLVPDNVAAAVMSCMARHRVDRPRSARALAAALRHSLAATPPLPPPRPPG